MSERSWKVGELAAEAGLTVRTLHYFDEIGLLTPGERSAGGHRLYSAPDVQRLYRILALRGLGMPLTEVATALDGSGGTLRSAVHRQLEQVEQRIAAQRRLHRRLLTLVTTLREANDPTVDQLVATMEAMMNAGYFTPEQLTRLKERHREVGGDAFGQWRRRWAELDAEAVRQTEQGVDPADPAAQQLAGRWTTLMDDMTGGDRRILSSMYAKLDGQGAEAATLGVVSTTAWTHLKRALAVGHGRPSADSPPAQPG